MVCGDAIGEFACIRVFLVVLYKSRRDSFTFVFTLIRAFERTNPRY